MGTFYDTILKPALKAVGLPASRPATDDAPAVRGVRLHDLLHTFTVLQLSADTHFMHVSKWLGHSTFTLTLDVYGDYIPEEDGGAANTLPELPRPYAPPRRARSYRSDDGVNDRELPARGRGSPLVREVMWLLASGLRDGLAVAAALSEPNNRASMRCPEFRVCSVNTRSFR